MAHYAHGWIGTLAGMLDMEEEHCRENLRHYGSGPDHDTYSAFLADVLELRKRLRLYDAAPELLEALRILRVQFGDYTDGDGAAKFHACNIADAAIAKADGRSE